MQYRRQKESGMKKFAVILFAALALTFAAISGAAAMPRGDVQASPVSPLGWPPDCMRVPPGVVKCIKALGPKPPRMPPGK
jgi:hypothetical protein